ncbi:hypothetical protein Goshw_010334 [Gossypium schwendimanii]|uniref:UDP-glycosyltransferases domain-containing protein n=1 Tax=Gossypium schwendimanii TaxID=34291 RepID=A0A7J9KX11_GOSSC|nr:hypothetical protein [Gossypium schwendimanii]
MKWFPDPALDAYTKSLTALPPDGIQLIDLPRVDPPSLAPWKSAESIIDSFIKCYIPPVRNAVRDIVSMKCSSDETRVAGLVLDLFCSPMIDIATDFGFVNPVPTYVLPSAVFSKDGGYAAYVKVAERFKDAKGIIINTFEEIEHYALNCFSNGQNPPVYPVGPVINLNGLSYSDSDDKVMKWLDDQPQSSVVFLCFGSMGSFKAPQVKETALGLEQCGFRFLWSLRVQPPQNDASNMLPEGFLERVQGRGMICSWAPQLKVLAHEAIGGFISHCGWNSILESLWFGVPIVTWPLYAEQQLNAYKMVKELGLAVEMRLNYRKDSDEVVMADEIEKAVGMVMDGGSEMRKKVKEMGEIARKSVMEGGTSFNSIGKLIENMIGDN